jgi:hypothetical protein
MLQWLGTAMSTYVLHPLHDDGYQWWSGAGSDLAYLGIVLGVLKHVNCEQHGCWRPGHRHPGHGRPVCRKHYHNDVEPDR